MANLSDDKRVDIRRCSRKKRNMRVHSFLWLNFCSFSTFLFALIEMPCNLRILSSRHPGCSALICTPILRLKIRKVDEWEWVFSLLLSPLEAMKSSGHFVSFKATRVIIFFLSLFSKLKNDVPKGLSLSFSHLILNAIRKPTRIQTLRPVGKYSEIIFSRSSRSCSS